MFACYLYKSFRKHDIVWGIWNEKGIVEKGMGEIRASGEVNKI